LQHQVREEHADLLNLFDLKSLFRCSLETPLQISVLLKKACKVMITKRKCLIMNDYIYRLIKLGILSKGFE